MTLLAVVSLNAQNLVKNGELLLSEKGKPMGWRMNDHKITAIKEGLPKGVSTGVKVEVIKSIKYDGYINQYIKGISADSTYKLTGWLKSSKAKMAYIQVKLIKDKKELKRISSRKSTTEWQDIEMEFQTLNADSIAVLCRFNQQKADIGQTASFADIKLTKKSDLKKMKIAE